MNSNPRLTAQLNRTADRLANLGERNWPSPRSARLNYRAKRAAKAAGRGIW